MRKYELQDDGSRSQTGPVNRKKLFKELICPMVGSMVSPGKKYEGYTPMFQGDNAGPHQDE
eukprot:1415873-Ditylum_brightwellii.AAC.3